MDYPDDAYAAGWDITVPIADPGVDPFAHLSDEELLGCNAGIVAAIVSAQANQRRILDPGIVPDAELVRHTARSTGRFNEIAVTTPTVPAEKFRGADGKVVVPPAPFYPGMAERSKPITHSLIGDLGDNSGCPVANALAHGVALLQIGVEAGHDVAPMAAILNAAWGGAPIFSVATSSGVLGTQAFKRMAAATNFADARLLYSWQKTSAIRSGVLTAQASDFGPALHLDYRRCRVAAENYFQITLDMETWETRPIGAVRLVYFVPPTAALSATPSAFYPDDVGVLAVQSYPTYAGTVLAAVLGGGVLEYLWPAGYIDDEEYVGVDASGGLRLAPAQFRQVVSRNARISAALALRGTLDLGAGGTSATAGVGRTIAKALSAKLSAIGYASPTTHFVSWASKVATAASIIRSVERKEDKVALLKAVTANLQGEFARSLEVNFTDEELLHMEMDSPAELREKTRSMKTVIHYLVWEVARGGMAESHTVLRGLKRVLENARHLAISAQIAPTGLPRGASRAALVSTFVQPLRAYWRATYGASTAVVGSLASAHIRNDLHTALLTAAAVDRFRASFMESLSVATDDRERYGSFLVEGVTLYFKPYHAAAKLRESLSQLLAVDIAPFGASAHIDEWLTQVGYDTAEKAEVVMASLPRAMDSWRVSGVSLMRGVALLTQENGLALWVRDTVADVVGDLTAMLEARKRPGRFQFGPIEDIQVTAERQADTVVAMQAALEAAFESMGTALTAAAAAGENPWFDAVQDEVDDDTWDNFVVAEYEGDTTAKELMIAAREASTQKEVLEVADEISATFCSEVASTSRRIR